jgi:hypothetical protein
MPGEDIHIHDSEYLLICEPVSRRGKDALERIKSKTTNLILTINDFYEYLYAEPFFIDPEDNEAVAVDENDDFAFSPKGIATSELLNRKNKFEDHFFHEKTDPLLLIRGSSGAGKTIYLNKLMQEWKENNSDRTGDYRIMEVNLEESISETIKGNVTFPEKGKSLTTVNGNSSAQCYFLVQLLDKTFDKIWEIRETMDTEKAAYLQENFKKLYGIHFPDEVKNSLDILSQTKCEDDEAKRVLAGRFFKNLIEHCVDYDNIKKSITNTLKLFTRFLLCDSGMENHKQILFTFDSIEHYIDIKTRIYDSDISVIVDSVHQFMEDEKNYYKKVNMVFAACFKFIMVVRDTTDKMFSIDVHDHFSNHVDNSIDITHWYSTNKIFKKKMEYIKFLKNDPIIGILTLIIEDSSKFNTSIMELVTTMYNYNKRRISGILTRVAGFLLDLKENPDKNQKVIEFDDYISYWKQDSIIYKYMLRRSILRIILNLIKTTNYFDFISAKKDINGKIQDKQTYTRRILTWLSRKGNEKKEYISFQELINGVLQSPVVGEKTVTRERVNDLAEILLALDEFRFDAIDGGRQTGSNEIRPNKWCQLAIIKFNDSNFNSKALSQKMWEEYQAELSESDQYGVKITDAGRFFIYIQCDFEYFACRYAKSNTPLLLLRDFGVIEETIRSVYNRAKECIDYVIWKEHLFTNGNFRALDNRNYHYCQGSIELPFPYRVIKKHRQYLLQYKEIIGLKEGAYLGKEEDEKLIKIINTYAGNYKSIFSRLKNDQYTVNGIEKTVKNYFSPSFDGSV